MKTANAASSPSMEDAMVTTDRQWGLESLRCVLGQRGAARSRPIEIVLEEDETWSFEASNPGLELRCLSGEVWVTMERDPQDHVLAAGASFSTPHEGRIAMMALRPTRLGLRLVPPSRRNL
jgi:hypothetical protein